MAAGIPWRTSKNLNDPSPVTSDPLGQNLGVIVLKAPLGDPRAAALGMRWDEATGRVRAARLPWGRWTAEAGKRQGLSVSCNLWFAL